jgi:peptidoglycan/LPS O-acetylase OafA/YrhL
MNHFASLDGLRGIAVLFVLISHLSNNQLLLLPYVNFGGSGKYGVYLFFVLSSYLLDRQIAKAMLLEKATARFWINYFFRRFLRIYPLYLLVLVINYTMSENGNALFIDLSSTELWQHIILQEGYSVFWSIPVEFKYYFFSPLVMLAFNHLLKRKYLCYSDCLHYLWLLQYYLLIPKRSA